MLKKSALNKISIMHKAANTCIINFSNALYQTIPNQFQS